MSIVRSQIRKLTAREKKEFFDNSANSKFLDLADSEIRLSRISNFPALVYNTDFFYEISEGGQIEFFKNALSNSDVAILLDKEIIHELFSGLNREKFGKLIGVKTSLPKYFPEMFDQPSLRINALAMNPPMRKFIDFSGLTKEDKMDEIEKAFNSVKLTYKHEKKVAFLFSCLMEDEKEYFLPIFVLNYPFLLHSVKNQNENLLKKLISIIDNHFTLCEKNGSPTQRYPSLLRYLNEKFRTKKVINLLKQSTESISANFKFFRGDELTEEDYCRVLRKNPFIIREIPKSKQTAEMCDIAIMGDPILLKDCKMVPVASELFLAINNPELQVLVDKKRKSQKNEKRK